MNRAALTIEIHLQESLDERWASWFEELALDTAADGTTRLIGPARHPRTHPRPEPEPGFRERA